MRAILMSIQARHNRNIESGAKTSELRTKPPKIELPFKVYTYESGFDGVVRPDHGRMIWDERAMPGYGLYDRALGAVYLMGLWEAMEKGQKRDSGI